MPFPWKPSPDAPVPAATQRGLPEFGSLMLDSLPNPTVLIEVVGPKRYRFCAANKLGINSFGINVIVGKYIEEVVPEEYIQPLYQLYEHTIEQKSTITYEQNFNPDPFSEAFWLSISCIPILDYRNDVTHLLSYGEDVNARKKLELLQQEQQAARLAELSTPLLSISDDTLVMPLIGAIDSARVNQLIQTLLNGASQQHAHTVILDITGVQIVDTQVANALIQAAQSLNLYRHKRRAERHSPRGRPNAGRTWDQPQHHSDLRHTSVGNCRLDQSVVCIQNASNTPSPCVSASEGSIAHTSASP